MPRRRAEAARRLVAGLCRGRRPAMQACRHDAGVRPPDTPVAEQGDDAPEPRAAGDDALLRPTTISRREHDGIKVFDASGAAGRPSSWPVCPRCDREHTLFVVDPLGNLVMRYDVREEPAGLLTTCKQAAEALAHRLSGARRRCIASPAAPTRLGGTSARVLRRRVRRLRAPHRTPASGAPTGPAATATSRPLAPPPRMPAPRPRRCRSARPGAR